MNFDILFKNPIIIGLLLMIISAFVSYKLFYYFTHDIDSSCLFSAAIAVITLLMSLNFLLNL